ncbi:protein-glutamate o-methyltransferase : Protein-glutamate O-methyltransferase OS=Anaeromyxobacter sp. (strain Fw109-5) GN=Anae109_2370 PE=4 SV=1: CheR [Gemmata massiliana]|uniref:CheR-type methyltransferase domain-containing protein n=1 Tax=Gemmata massiliana TaxID=1210884 RepID=A0A6P2CTT2_9BACT|nr:protein-glutamate O-methyltransferase CheR [Gemmata massiliana]VTR92558.1 protein-glutamate o-methyltransferase : Protein-glutamate O-methyltransferase OS=Anaeromyxobacter sp. (strain Fw109-5) GN=Anae109_2370 PE=4 SV=1: CheR [Gemmata massiliana]
MNAPDRELIDRFRDAVARRFGLDFDDSRRDFLGEILVKHVARAKSADPFSYIHRLVSGQAPRSETADLATDLTVGETYFFRHPDQFRAFVTAAELDRHPPPGPRRLHILSAGCASGEEAHSLAILLREHVPDGSGWNLRVVGIDLNPVSLARAARGRYTAWSLRGSDETIKQRHFHARDREYQLDDSVRAMVTFEERNLLSDAPDFWRPGAYDVIFCRNVIMYFTPEAARAVVARLTRALVPGGHLFLGPAETLRSVSNDYHLLHTHDTFYYQRRRDTTDALQFPVESRIAREDALFPVLSGADGSWVTAIGEASDRIARLRREMRPVGPAASPASGGPISGDEAPPVPEVARPLDLRTAREMVRQERYADALQVLGVPAGEDRRDPDAQLLRAVILTNCGHVAEAEQLCHDVLSGDELNAEARYLLALCREHAGEFDSATEEDGIAIYLDPRFAMPHLHLGLLRKRAGDRAGAHRAFREAAALLPREDASRVVLFGGGFSREMLLRLCEAELRAREGDS